MIYTSLERWTLRSLDILELLTKRLHWCTYIEHIYISTKSNYNLVLNINNGELQTSINIHSISTLLQERSADNDNRKSKYCIGIIFLIIHSNVHCDYGKSQQFKITNCYILQKEYYFLNKTNFKFFRIHINLGTGNMVNTSRNKYVGHQRSCSLLNDWRLTRVSRDWCDEQADFEVTLHGQHLKWITPSTYQCTMVTLKTV